MKLIGHKTVTNVGVSIASSNIFVITIQTYHVDYYRRDILDSQNVKVFVHYKTKS